MENKLHPLQEIFCKSHPSLIEQLKIEPFRCTGRSTALAFRYIARAYEEPGHWISIYDHYDNICAHKQLLSTINSIVSKLAFECFEFKIDRNKCQMRLKYAH